MAARVFLSQIERQVAPLAAREIGRIDAPGYPLPPLELAGPPQSRQFTAIVLENDLLRAELLPELGGRIVSIMDRRTQTECLAARSEFEVAHGGPRGLWIPAGIQWMIGEPIRRTSMAELDVQILESEDGDAARVVLFEAIPGLELSWHLWLELPGDRAELRVEWRALNRSLEELPYVSRIVAGIADAEAAATENALILHHAPSDAGLIVQFEPGEFDRFGAEASSAWLERRFPLGALAPRQTDHLSATIVPFSQMGSPSVAASGVVLAIDSSGVSLQSVRSAEGTAYILSEADRTLEAKVTLPQSEPIRLDWPEGTTAPVAVRFLSQDRSIDLNWPPEPFPIPKTDDLGEPPLLEGLRRRDPRHRAASSIGMAQSALARNHTEAARAHLEDAITFNGDDPLAWWLMAVVARHSGTDEDRPELPNAHFLAPMEPMLRVEAFLSQPVSMDAGPNPLVVPLAELPDLLVEVAARLIASGCIEDSVRFIDEALRHHDLAMLRYLAAANFLAHSSLAAEAGLHIAAAGKIPYGPPFPWRPVEIECLETLFAVFPNDAMLPRYLSLVE